MPAEYTAIFLVDNHAEDSGFMMSEPGTCEYNTNLFLIIVGDGGRQWFQSSYIDRHIKPIGKLDTIIPEGPAHPNALLDACIAFAPEFFESCPTLDEVKSTIPYEQRVIDFDMDSGNSKIPEKWSQLREEARPIYDKKVRMLRWDFHKDNPLDLDGKYSNHKDEY